MNNENKSENLLNSIWQQATGRDLDEEKLEFIADQEFKHGEERMDEDDDSADHKPDTEQELTPIADQGMGQEY